jgi:mono/diheme cytochrome c family protein
MFARLIIAVLAFVGLITVAAGTAFLAGGISARSEPGTLEKALAPRLRAFAIPASARNRLNPVPASAEVFEEGMAHWADHCATCHANNGDGQTELGRGLYPRVPDMRKPETQKLSDGTLFHIIEHGVRLTGMPAWGTGSPDGEAASWHLVHFIRKLPSLTNADLERMKAMNPKSPDEWRAAEEMRSFIEGKGPVPRPAAKRHSHDHK